MTGDPAGRLRSVGLRATAQRVAILETLAAIGGHRTADEIGTALAGSGAAVPRASLFHALAALAGRAVILVVDAGPGTARYEVAEDWHHHHVCRSCGAITDVPCVRGRRPCLEIELPGVVVDEAQVVFRGTCAACAAGPAAGSALTGGSRRPEGSSDGLLDLRDEVRGPLDDIPGRNA